MKIVFSLLFTFTLLMGAAQNDRFIEFSAGLKHYQARDEYQSPLTYKGWVVSRGLGFSQVRNQQESRNRLDVLSGSLKNKAPHQNTLNYRGLNYQSFDYNPIPAASMNTTVSYFLGFSVRAIFSSRNQSKRGQFDVATSIAIVAAAAYKEKPTDRWSHEAILSLPVFAWAVRPRYTSPLYIKSGSKIKAPSHLFLTIPKYFGFDFQIGSRWEMDNGNAFRINYESQYYQILPLHPVRVFSHGIITTALMKIN